MSLILCENVSPGLRDSEALATVLDFNGRRHSIRVEKDFLSTIQDREYLPIGIVQVDPKSKAILVEFPHEPETGINRIWVKPEQLDQPIEAYA